jgi:opacity protein-like surface antigen
MAIILGTADGWGAPAGTPYRLQEQPSTSEWFTHIRIGTRLSHAELDDDKRRPSDRNADGDISPDEVLAVSYMGSITELEVEQLYIPTQFYVQWEVSPYWGIETGWDHLKTDTWTYWDGHTDGSFFLSGLHLGVYGRYPNRTRFTPYVEAGITWFSTDFNAEEQWTVMMDDETYTEWMEAGSPAEWFDGRQQHLNTDDAFGTVVMAGCEMAITETLSLELFARYINVDVYAHWTNTQLVFSDENPDGVRQESTDNGIFRYPLTTTALGLGIQYSF